MFRMLKSSACCSTLAKYPQYPLLVDLSVLRLIHYLPLPLPHCAALVRCRFHRCIAICCCSAFICAFIVCCNCCCFVIASCCPFISWSTQFFKIIVMSLFISSTFSFALQPYWNQNTGWLEHFSFRCSRRSNSLIWVYVFTFSARVVQSSYTHWYFSCFLDCHS